ncbi:hypothetical protein [Alishewanella longhuensis]
MQDRIEQLVIEAPTVLAEAMAFEVSELFRHNPLLQSLAVLRGAKPVGLICRAELQALFAHPFGASSNEKKTIGQLMNSKAVMVEADCSLDQVSQIVAEDEHNAGSWYFIICRKGDYLGLGSVRQLLKK